MVQAVAVAFWTAALLLGVLTPLVEGGCCPNSCSGHGTCSTEDTCSCYANWQSGENATESGDCSDRACPYDRAWGDAPDKLGQHHYYAECSNQGTCDRSTGSCSCFSGYEGKACQRQVCPTSGGAGVAGSGDVCSGHGRCQYIHETPYGVNVGSYWDDPLIITAATPASDIADSQHPHLGDTNGADPAYFSYFGWDRSRSRICQCDAGYEGVDCSLKSCPKGNDVILYNSYRLGVSQKYQRQTICLFGAGPESDGTTTKATLNAQTFALSFTTRTGERFTTRPILIDYTDTTFSVMESTIAYELMTLPGGVIDTVSVTVEFDDDGSTLYGTALQTATCDMLIDVQFDGNTVQGDQNLLEVEWRPCTVAGCTPMITGLDLSTSQVMDYATLSYVKQYQASSYKSYTCGNRGKCDYTTGTCNCFSGFFGIHCETQTALV